MSFGWAIAVWALTMPTNGMAIIAVAAMKPRSLNVFLVWLVMVEIVAGIRHFGNPSKARFRQRKARVSCPWGKAPGPRDLDMPLLRKAQCPS